MGLQAKLNDLKIINNHYIINENLTLTGNVFLDHKYKFMKPKFFDEIEGKRFLDIGCNAGYFVILAKQLGAKESIGIDKDFKYISIAREVAGKVAVDVKLEEEKFSEDLLRFGVFDTINLCSLYHYIFMDIKNHDTIFRILSLMTENLFFENPLGIDDPVVLELSNKPGNEILKTEYTKEKILAVAGKYFNCEYLADHLYPNRKIYWMTRKRGNFNVNEFTSKEQVHEYLGHKYYKVNLPGIKRNFFLKRRLGTEEHPINSVKEGCDCYLDKLKHIPGVTILYDYFISEQDGVIYILMEYLSGYANIYTFLPEEKQSIRNQSVEIISQMVKAECINCDISPLNIFQKKGQVKMIDLDNIKPIQGIQNERLVYFSSKLFEFFRWY